MNTAKNPVLIDTFVQKFIRVGAPGTAPDTGIGQKLVLSTEYLSWKLNAKDAEHIQPIPVI